MKNDTYAAQFRQAVKEYPGFTLGPLQLDVPAGSIVGLIGENGAGKTTALKLLCGVNRPTAGEVTLLGGSPLDAARRMELGTVFEDSFFPDCLTAVQVGKSLQGIFGARWDAAHYQSLLQRFALAPEKQLKQYSRGMRLKLQLAAALAHHPSFLVLDEATSGLDPVVRGELLDLFLEFIQVESHSILLSSHITADLEQIADSIAYLHRGKLLFHENKDELLGHYGILRCSEAALAQLPDTYKVHTRRSSLACETLVRDRAAVLSRLPDAVCDAAGIDDIMRFTAGRDAK